MSVIAIPKNDTTKLFVVRRIDGVVIKIRANSYFLNYANSYVFTMMLQEDIWKLVNKGQSPAAVFEMPKRLIDSIEEEGFVTSREMATPQRKPVCKPKKPKN